MKCNRCIKMSNLDGDQKSCNERKPRLVSSNLAVKGSSVLCLKDGCKHKKSTENVYCKLHQLQIFIDDTKSAGKKLCSNVNRGCRTQSEESYKFSSCQSCLKAAREKDYKKRDKVKKENEETNIVTESLAEKGCTKCCKILPLDQFLAILPPYSETLNCITCRERNSKQDLKRDKERRNEIARNNDSTPERIAVKKEWKENNYAKQANYWMNSRQHKIEALGMEEYLRCNAKMSQNWRDKNPEKQIEINEARRNSYESQYGVDKRSACLKNLEFSISSDEYREIVKMPCHYCGIIQDRGTEQFNGIDRDNSALGYVLGNCFSSCTICNYMKNTLSGAVFVNRVEHILTYNKHIAGNLFPQAFGDHLPTFQTCRNRANQKKIDFSITKDNFYSITAREFYMCGKEKTITHSNGIDRRDNNLGYLLGNCASCCGQCNYMKRNYEYKDVFYKFNLI